MSSAFASPSELITPETVTTAVCDALCMTGCAPSFITHHIAATTAALKLMKRSQRQRRLARYTFNCSVSKSRNASRSQPGAGVVPRCAGSGAALGVAAVVTSLSDMQLLQSVKK